MINVGRIVMSRNFAQPGGFVVYRQSGAWVAGRWVTSEASINLQGTVTVATSDDLIQVPEGDRVKGVMCFYSKEPMYGTHAQDGATPSGTSDEIVWKDDRYRVFSAFPWGDYGYYKALAVRMVGD